MDQGRQGSHWTRLSCHRFRANEVRLLLGVIAYNIGNPAASAGLADRHPKLVPHEPPTAAVQHGRTPHPACAVLHPATRRKLLDTAPVLADRGTHRAACVAPDVIERTAHGGSEKRSRIGPGGGVAEAGGQEWHASEQAGPAGQESREGSPVIYSAPAERQVGERATRLAM